MICYTLRCAKDHEFEAWFRSGEDFEEQSTLRQISCPSCGSSEVRKAVMAPAVTRSRSLAPAAPPPASGEPPSRERMIAMIRQLRARVESSFIDVGERFPEEARRIHYGQTDPQKIYGKASLADARDLHEEGIPVLPLPDVPDLDG